MLSRPALWIAALSACSGCSNPLSPSEVIGDWSARDGGHFAWTSIRFTATGSEVEGRACHIDGDHITFMDAPVRLDGRHVTIRVTTDGITRIFDGEFNHDSQEIVGAWRNSPNRLTFTRNGGYCANTE